MASKNLWKKALTVSIVAHLFILPYAGYRLLNLTTTPPQEELIELDLSGGQVRVARRGSDAPSSLGNQGGSTEQTVSAMQQEQPNQPQTQAQPQQPVQQSEPDPNAAPPVEMDATGNIIPPTTNTSQAPGLRPGAPIGTKDGNPNVPPNVEGKENGRLDGNAPDGSLVGPSDPDMDPGSTVEYIRPELIRGNTPRTQRLADNRGLHGNIGLMIHIDANGEVTSVSLISPSSSDALNNAAVQDAENFRYTPAKNKAGYPLPSRVKQTIRV